MSNKCPKCKEKKYKNFITEENKKYKVCEKCGHDSRNKSQSYYKRMENEDNIFDNNIHGLGNL